MKKIYILLFALLSINIANAQTAYITNYSSNTVSVINVATNTVMDTITVGDSPYGVSVSSDGSKVYVVNQNAGTVSVINAATNTVSATITVGDYPKGISVSPDGSKVYVANLSDNTVSVINTATNTVTATITVTNPYGVSVSPDGSKVYVANDGVNTVSVINTATNTVTATIAVGALPYGVSVSPDGSKVYVANEYSNTVSVINITTNTVTATIPVGTYPYGVSVSPDGSKVYVTNYGDNTVSVINTSTNLVTATIPVGALPYGVSISPDGSKVYVANFNSNSNTVSVINIATNTVTATIPVGFNPVAFGNFISTFNPLFIGSVNLTMVNCNGGNNGTATVVSMYSGTPPYTYVWNTTPAQTTQTATGLAAGSYTVTVTDYNGLSDMTSVTITQPSAINISTSNATICKGSDTIICFTVLSGGTSPYTYLWSNSVTSSCQTVSPVNTANYSATVTDANGCTATSSLTVTVDTAAKPVITPSGSMLFSTAGASYQWYLNGNPISGATGQFYSPLIPGNYSVTVTYSNDCSATSNIYFVTGINELTNSLYISIHPNPATDYITIEALQKAEIEILNIQGQILKTISSIKNNVNIDISFLPSGVYILKVKTVKGIAVKKFIKE